MSKKTTTPTYNHNQTIEKISARELAILKYTCHGLTASEIADNMKLTVKNVGMIRLRLVKKLNFKSMNQLIYWAGENGI